MTTETDKQFVERVCEDHCKRMDETLGSYITAHLLALALRGAETQWRPIEEAGATQEQVHLGLVGGEPCFVRYYSGAGKWKSGIFQEAPTTHFIPLSALGEPKP